MSLGFMEMHTDDNGLLSRMNRRHEGGCFDDLLPEELDDGEVVAYVRRPLVDEWGEAHKDADVLAAFEAVVGREEWRDEPKWAAVRAAAKAAGFATHVPGEQIVKPRAPRRSMSEESRAKLRESLRYRTKAVTSERAERAITAPPSDIVYGGFPVPADWLTLRHPTLPETQTIRQSREAYLRGWRHKGWVIVEDPERDAWCPPIDPRMACA